LGGDRLAVLGGDCSPVAVSVVPPTTLLHHLSSTSKVDEAEKEELEERDNVEVVVEVVDEGIPTLTMSKDNNNNSINISNDVKNTATATTTLTTTTTTTTTTMTTTNKPTIPNSLLSGAFEAASSTFPLRASTSVLPSASYSATPTSDALVTSSAALTSSAPMTLSGASTTSENRRKRERENDTLDQPTHFKLSKNTLLCQPMISNLAYEVLLKGIETMRDYAIFVLNPDGTVASWNKGAEVSDNISSYFFLFVCFVLFLHHNNNSQTLKTNNTTQRNQKTKTKTHRVFSLSKTEH